MTNFIAGQPVPLAAKRVPVLRVLAPNAGPMTGHGTNSYLLGSQRLALVDPGPALPRHMDKLLDAIGDRQLAWILVTHTHGDHSPAAAVLASRTGAQLVGLAAPHAHHNDTSFEPDRPYHHGEVLHCDDFTIELIHTPGHVSNHLCYLLREEGLLFTGDHILDGSTSVILPPDGNMGHYMASLQQLLDYPLQALAPGHGDVITAPRDAIMRLIRHRQQRELKVINALDPAAPAGLDRLTPVVYNDVAAHLLPWARLTLLAHLLKLAEEERAMETEQGWLSRP
ncbi:MAG: hypothetical protein RLZZ385_2198 [Pseudomonadota bacterium]|jgi:glyoxylase-like metal-dependent hydrolase (beta-lactamase superfamily II)